MTDLGSWIKFFHVLAALWLAAGAFSGAVVRAQVRRAATMQEKVAGLRIAGRLIDIYGIPGSIAAGLLGIWLAVKVWSFQGGWIHASLGLWLVLLVISLTVSAPHLKKLQRAGEAAIASGGSPAEFQRLAANKVPGILADVAALGIVVLTLLMVFKPF